MSLSLIDKKEFLNDFQEKVVQGRRLLQSGNHRWADKLLNTLYMGIESSEWLSAQKKHQLITVISNSWWIYLNFLTHKRTDESGIDLIRYVDAYKRFFSFLSKLSDSYLFNNFVEKLLDEFIEMKNLSTDGITKFINSVSLLIKKRGENLKLIQYQILLMYLRKSVVPTEFFNFAMEQLGRTIFKLQPGKRALFLYVLIEDINIKFNILKDSDEFVQSLTKILTNRIPGYLKTEFGNLGRITINEKTIPTIIEVLKCLIFYLNDINEHKWIIIILRNLYTKIEKYKTFEDAVEFVRNFIDFAIGRNRFEIAFEMYDFLEDVFILKADLGYDEVLIELWVEACKKFVDMKEKKYLLQSIEKLNTHLKTPQNKTQIFHYFYTCNYLWKFKSMFFSLERSDFWRMMFYRALYDEKDYDLAEKIVPYLNKKIRPLLSNLSKIYEESLTYRNNIYDFDSHTSLKIPNEFQVEQLILRINNDGAISFRLKTSSKEIMESTIEEEYWNDSHIIEIYNDLFSESAVKNYNFSLIDFGKLVRILLPKTIREIFSKCEITSLDSRPQIYFILQEMTIPFELMFYKNFYLLKYACGYKIGNPPLGGINFKHYIGDQVPPLEEKNSYSVAIVDSINSLGPKKWNEEEKTKDLIYPFPAGGKELNFITNFFNTLDQIQQITILSGVESTRENILKTIAKGAYDIIHFVGNLFYSKWNPKDSYFITNDKKIVKFSDICQLLKKNTFPQKPFLFFNTQLYDVEGNRLTNYLRPFGEIVEQFDHDDITGIMCRNYPIFNDDTKNIVANFYKFLISRVSQGNALLTARQLTVADKTTSEVERQLKSLQKEVTNKKIDIESSLAISSFLLFGKPWKELNKQ